VFRPILDGASAESLVRAVTLIPASGEFAYGATVKRTLSTGAQSVIYPATQQTADWGAPLGPGETLDVRIFQVSALVGRGAPQTVTLSF
jgi:hypothetical protein